MTRFLVIIKDCGCGNLAALEVEDGDELPFKVDDFVICSEHFEVKVEAVHEVQEDEFWQISADLEELLNEE